MKMKNPRHQSNRMSAAHQGILPLSLAWVVCGVSVFFLLSGCSPAIASQEYFKITAYCACVKCCGKSDGITASGKHAKANHTIACNWLKFGTRVLINGKTFVVEDRGGRSQFGSKKNPIKHIDVFFNNHSEALRFGVQQLKTEILG